MRSTAEHWLDGNSWELHFTLALATTCFCLLRSPWGPSTSYILFYLLQLLHHQAPLWHHCLCPYLTYSVMMSSYSSYLHLAPISTDVVMAPPVTSLWVLYTAIPPYSSVLLFCCRIYIIPWWCLSLVRKDLASDSHKWPDMWPSGQLKLIRPHLARWR